ncbi:MAG: GntR family transcriptional regulator [Halieaceae bacterium]|jgi:GntR family transcriptional regulator
MVRKPVAPKKARTKTSSRDSGSAVSERLVPLHHQIYMVLRRRLLEGRYPEDKPLPGEHRLAEEFAVSRVTIRRTLERLEAEELVTRRRGSGTFPGAAAGDARLTVPLGTLRAHLENGGVERQRLELVDCELVTPAPFLNRGRVSFGRRVLRVRRVAFHGDSPAHFVTSYVPGDLSQEIDGDALGNATVLSRLEEAGQEIGELEVTLTAVSAELEVARLLGVSVGTPLLLQQRLTLDPQGQPLEYFEGLSRPEEYRYQFAYSKEEQSSQSLPWRAPG